MCGSTFDAGRGFFAAVFRPPLLRAAAMKGSNADLGRRFAHALPSLRTADLPAAAVTSDFKANNLVYTSTGPVMVDPDNGGVEPRLLDLALAVRQR